MHRHSNLGETMIDKANDREKARAREFLWSGACNRCRWFLSFRNRSIKIAVSRPPGTYHRPVIARL